MFAFKVLAGTASDFARHRQAMRQYRFITKNRRGKWYSALALAQAFASRIGAGFVDAAGNFVPYRGTVLEIRQKPEGDPEKHRL